MISGVFHRIVFLVACLSIAMQAGAASPEREILVGVNYFAGWWEPEPNKWHTRDGRDWREDYPQRVPLLGQYNDQATMDKEIVAAADHGVDFFAILWYGAESRESPHPHGALLNRGVEHFMASPQAGRLKFMIEYCNHPPFGIKSEARWSECVQTWIAAMKHSSYLRVGGRCVFKVHGGHYFLLENDRDMARSRARLDALRQAARDAGVGELVIGVGVGDAEPIPAGHWAEQLFDFTASYMGIPPIPQREEDYPFTDLRAYIAEGRLKHAADAVPYLPFAAAGWNPRPWGDPRPRFTLPTREEWTESLVEMKSHLSQHRFGLPLPDGSVQPAFTIYAWNEFGEGGMVAPTGGEQYMKLEAIREVFGADKP